MGKKSCRIPILIHLIAAVIFVLLASLIRWDSNYILEIFYRPFALLGTGIRSMIMDGNGGAVFAGYALYILIGVLPLIYPAIATIRKKRFAVRHLIWPASSVFLWVMMYFFINPHLLDSVLFSTLTSEALLEYRRITLIGFTFTLTAIVLLGIFCECSAAQRVNGERTFLYAKALLTIFGIAVSYSIFFDGIVQLRLAVQSVRDAASSQFFDGNAPLNYAVAAIAYLLRYLPAWFGMLLIWRADRFLDCAKEDVFDIRNVDRLDRIIATAKRSVVVTLTTMIVTNLLYLICSRQMLYSGYQLYFPLTLLLGTCLVIIASRLLIRAIRLNDESKLVI